MNDLIMNIATLMLQSVQKKFNGNYSSIKDVKIFWHNLQYLFFSAINHQRLFPNTSFCLSNLATLQLAPNSLILFESNNKDITSDFLSSMLECPNIYDFDLAILRENLLEIDLCVTKNTISIINNRHRRDTTGSYYTPYSLAKSIVKKMFSSYNLFSTLTNEKRTIKIADFSCGGGEFFKAAQDFIYERFNIPYTDSCKLFWGVDVDPIILQISICNLLIHARENDWSEIISHFHLGNPLVSSCDESSFDIKNEHFALGRLYSPQMGINFSNSILENSFDLVLGNPPWEKIRFEERKFFSCLHKEISELSKKDERVLRIANLQKEWNELYNLFSEISSDYANMSSSTYKHPLISYANSGELNTYTLFTELSYNLLRDSGVCTLVVKSTLATSPAYKRLWNHFLKNHSIKSIYFFDNKNKIFNIDAREKFAVLSVSNTTNHSFVFASGLTLPLDLETCHEISLSEKDVSTINPFTNMLPNTNSTESIQTLMNMHNAHPLFEEIYPDCHFGRLIHLTSHAEMIDQIPSSNNVPIYEGKFIDRYDARFSTFAGIPEFKRYTNKASALKSLEVDGKKPIPESRYFVHKSLWQKYLRQYPEKFSLCWRSLTSTTNARTTLAMILPTCPTCQSIQLLQTKDNVDLLMLLALFNSLPFDYLVRLKMPGIDLTQSVIRQIPVPHPSRYKQTLNFNSKVESLKVHILSYVCYILKDENLLSDLIKEVNEYTYSVPQTVSRIEAIKDLDRLFAFAYGISEVSFENITQTFIKY